MCSAFSVRPKRCSVIMVSMTSCNLVLASFGVPSSTVRFHPMGVLSNGITLPVSILCANARSGPKQDTLSLLCHGCDRHRSSSHLCLSRFNGHWLVFCILGHQTCQLPSAVLQLPRRNDTCTLVSRDAVLAPRSCTLPCRLQT